MRRSLALIGVVIFLAGCSATPKVEPEPIWYGEGTVAHKIAYSDCYAVKIFDEAKVYHDVCVSEHVWNDAMLGHKITITKEYN
jgi:hypothetical protein